MAWWKRRRAIMCGSPKAACNCLYGSWMPAKAGIQCLGCLPYTRMTSALGTICSSVPTPCHGDTMLMLAELALGSSLLHRKALGGGASYPIHTRIHPDL